MLLDTEHRDTPRPPRSLLSLRWKGPCRILARAALNTCRLDIPAMRRVFPEFNGERLRPCLRRPDRLGGDSDVGPPPPAAGPDGVPEQELLKFNIRYGRPHDLVRCTGLDAAGDTWELLDSLTNGEAAWWSDDSDGWQRGTFAASPASARAAPSRTWWPAPGRRRRCAAWRTHYSTPAPTASAGCSSRQTSYV